MSCWCGHGPWHHHGYAYPPPVAYGPPTAIYYQPAKPYRRRRRRRADAEELADYLDGLEAERARIRRELDELQDRHHCELIRQPYGCCTATPMRHPTGKTPLQARRWTR